MYPFIAKPSYITVNYNGFGVTLHFRTFPAYGANKAPRLNWAGAPKDMVSFVCIVDDPDALTKEPFVHWLVYNIPAEVHTLDNPSVGKTGKNSYANIDYDCPKPPAGKVHHYHFKLYALNTEFSFNQPPTKTELLAAMQPHIIVFKEIISLYYKTI